MDQKLVVAGYENMDEEQEANKFLHAFLADKRMDEVQRYATKGHPLNDADTAFLKDEWVRAFGAWCNDHTDENLRLRYEDAEAELTLRGVAVPLDRVESELQILTQSAREALTEAKVDPERWDEFRDALREDMLRFARSIDEASEN
jgi:hypothetical protein